LSGLSGLSVLGLWLPFLIAAAIKTAQGSSTVAIITTASLVSPLIIGLDLGSDLSRALVVLAIGAGSSFVSHANDSYFWVVSQMSNMSMRQGYLMHTLGSAILGLSAMIIVTILSLLLNIV
jgi:GntP family gluconate:H+ symporter